MMKVKCPACGAAMSLDALIGHDEARAALVELSGISDELVRACLKYLGLFRPAEKDLTFARVAKLLGELRPMMQAAEISRNRQSYPAPREAWIWAFGQVLAARDAGKLNRLPLTSHGFLLETLTFWIPEKSPARGLMPSPAGEGARGSKLRQGVAGLAEWAGDDWLRQELASGLSLLATMNLKGRPAAADLAVTAEVWRQRLSQRDERLVAEFDRPRFQTAFRALQDSEEWPNAGDLIRNLPPRMIPRQLLEKPKPDMAAGREQAGRLKENLKQALKQKGKQNEPD